MKSEDSTTEGTRRKEMRLFNFESSFSPVKAGDTQCVILFYSMPFRMCNNEEDEEA